MHSLVAVVTALPLVQSEAQQHASNRESSIIPDLMEPSGARTTGNKTPCNTRMMTVSRITTDGYDAALQDSAFKSGDISQQAQSACLHDGSDIVLS